MTQSVTLNGTRLDLDVDRIEVHLDVPSQQQVFQGKVEPWVRDEGGDALEPIAAYRDGTTVFYHCAPEGAEQACEYVVESPRAFHWDVCVDEVPGNGSRMKIARIHLVLDESRADR